MQLTSVGHYVCHKFNPMATQLHKNHDYIHVTDERNKNQRLGNLPKVTLVNKGWSRATI